MVIQVLNSKLGITISVSVTSATIDAFRPCSRDSSGDLEQ